MKFMKLLFLLLLASVPIHASDFKIESVTQIGDATWDVGAGIVKFSPSGEYLSFIHSCFISIADGTGKVVAEYQIQSRVVKYEWLNDSELVVLETKRLEPPKSRWQLNYFNVPRQTRSVIREYVRHGDSEQYRARAFEDLQKTSSGQVVIREIVSDRILEITPGGKLSDVSASPSASPDEFVFKWGDGGIYKKNIITAESSLVIQHPTSPHVALLPPVWNPDQTYIMAEPILYCLADTSTVNVDTLLPPPPPGFKVCDVDVPQFNPVYPEIVFNLVCYGLVTPDGFELDRESDQVAILSIGDWKVTPLDSLVGLSECRSPTYAPDGLAMALISKGHVYVVSRSIW